MWVNRVGSSVRCPVPVFPKLRTSRIRAATSEKCQTQKWCWAQRLAREAERREADKELDGPREKFMRPFLLMPFLVLAALPALAAERWETLPPTPAPIATDRSGHAQVNG